MIEIDEDIADLLPLFAARRRAELEELAAAIDAGALDDVRRIGHRLKGAAGSYGFARLGEIGAEIERAGAGGDADAAREARARLASHLEEVRVRIEGREARLLDL